MARSLPAMTIPRHLLLALVFVGVLPLLVYGQAAAAKAYMPTVARCQPGFSLVRQAGVSSYQTLSTSETAYLTARHNDVLPGAWQAYLKNAQNTHGTNVSLPPYVSSILGGNASSTPNLGIAVSGGGYRAAIFGAGILNALDGRNSTAVSAGIGGLLQSATYLSGLSGGSWLVTSLAQANFPTIQELIFGSSSSDEYSGWLAQFGVTQPTNDTTQNQLFIAELLVETLGKFGAGFPITVADLWARSLARHFVNGTTVSNFFDNSTTHGAGITFSGLANLSAFTQHSAPFPIVVADSISSGNTPIYEFNFYEMGSFDPALAAFTPTQYLGTSNTSICVTGYDQAAFVTGTSSELFNQFNTSAAALDNSTIGPVIEFLNQSVPQPGIELDVTLYPNPFFGVNNGTFSDSGKQFLSLVDGGEDGQVIPIQPLLVKAREVDVIIAIDASGNASNWADGSSLIATGQRAALFNGTYDFPPVPNTTDAFASSSLTTQPTFFGCNTSTAAPLVVYLANGGPPRDSSATVTNTSTLQLAYEPTELQSMLDQTWAIATQGAGDGGAGADPMWPACLACAVVDRARNRAGAAREGTCVTCFDRYCWVEGKKRNAAWKVGHGRSSVWGVLVAGLVVTMLV